MRACSWGLQYLGRPILELASHSLAGGLQSGGLQLGICSPGLPIWELAAQSLAGSLKYGGLQLGAHILSTHPFWSWQCTHWLRAYSLGAYGWGPTVSCATGSEDGSALIGWGPTVWGPTVWGPTVSCTIDSGVGSALTAARCLQSGDLELEAYNHLRHRFRSWQRTHWLGAHSLGAYTGGPTISYAVDSGAGSDSPTGGLQSGGLQLGACGLGLPLPELAAHSLAGANSMGTYS